MESQESTANRHKNPAETSRDLSPVAGPRMLGLRAESRPYFGNRFEAVGSALSTGSRRLSGSTVADIVRDDKRGLHPFHQLALHCIASISGRLDAVCQGGNVVVRAS